MRISILLSVIILLSACSKKDGTTIPVVQNDTLTAGWSRVSNTNFQSTYDIFFTDATNGYVGGNPTGYYDSSIARSVDGGASFKFINHPAMLTPYNIAAIGNKATFVGSYTTICNTQDGGTTLNYTNISGLPADDQSFQDCFYSSSNICYLSSLRTIWKSTNGGVSFSQVYAFPYNTNYYNSVFFANDNVGWVGRDSALFKTTDGGNTWNVQYITPDLYNINTICAVNSNLVYFTTHGTSYKSTDGGSTWTSVVVTNLSGTGDIAFPDASNGFLSRGTELFKTTDGGATWTKVIGLANDSFEEIHFTDIHHGWACCVSGKIFKYVN